MCEKREEIEGALKGKINIMMGQLESNHSRVDALKQQINANNQKATAEEKTVMELHAKLKALEETLEAKVSTVLLLLLYWEQCINLR